MIDKISSLLLRTMYKICDIIERARTRRGYERVRTKLHEELEIDPRYEWHVR